MNQDTTSAAERVGDTVNSEYIMLKEKIEHFFAYEGELLDERNFDAWLELFAEDARYWMPLARNVKHNDTEAEYTREQSDAAWFDEDKKTLLQRVMQLKGGDHWAEEPFSRTTHIITNIRIQSRSETDVTVKSRFIVYVNRREEEVRLFVGKRIDVLRITDHGFLVQKRSIFLDQSKLLFKNLTTFF
ncbi:aromatic-ring-hydroxylating dioxygenase subunit beta [Kineobactrum salinum]|uniref:3-phenylpropionate/cinnamic acid dioxygenase subunit beta n=1 Tax=Kineobactrum salinum TaxID=2708301 RepID=A0A6C0TZX6_9GAMM|nr:3-phenylpropionate/cinnamic acid dioxygenase subunit beta [Kineobactrum salinum]QIB64899.1 3-phenylpropionate/cinnamic acid dioxygenase subunit beta [Kineobactrum salinum]